MLAKPTHVEELSQVPPTTVHKRRTSGLRATPTHVGSRVQAEPAQSVITCSSPAPGSRTSVRSTPSPLLTVREAEFCDRRWCCRPLLLLLLLRRRRRRWRRWRGQRRWRQRHLLLLRLLLLVLLWLLHRCRHRRTLRTGTVLRKRPLPVRAVLAIAVSSPPREITRSS